MSTTSIEWTERTWNPTVGCSKVSPGCDRCYAATVAHRGLTESHRGLTTHTAAGTDWTGEVRLVPSRLELPLTVRKPTTWFVDSMSDLFHPSVTNEYIEEVFAVMAATPQHTYQVLTKRPQRMAEWFGYNMRAAMVAGAAQQAGYSRLLEKLPMSEWWPLRNVWLGVSIESQTYAWRAKHLLATPATVRFVSAEPLLGPLDLSEYLGLHLDPLYTGIDWVIVGGESGPGARPMHPAWARDIRDQCQTAGVPFLFKQWGEWAPHPVEVLANGGWRSSIPPNLAGPAFLPNGPGDDGTPWEGHKFPVSAEAMVRPGKKAAGRELDGRTWDEFPA